MSSHGDEESRPDFCLVFARPGPALAITKQLLCQAGMTVQSACEDLLLLVTVSDDVIELEAELARLRKWHKGSNRLISFRRSERSCFCGEMHGAHITQQLFTSSERNYLANIALQRVTLDADFAKQVPGTVAEEGLLYSLHRLELITSSDGLHDSDKQQELWRMVCRLTVTPPTCEIRDYMGESVAYYFAWMSFYTKALLVPGLLALLLWVVSQMAGYRSVDTNPLVPFYSLSVILWAFLFVKLWQRQSNSLAFRWDTLDREKREELLPEFFGHMRTSLITGKQVLHYPYWKRRLRYLFSAVITLVMLFVAFFTMICSLNLQGYVNEFTRFGDDNPFHVGFLNVYALPGHIFDPKGPLYLSMIPCVLHAVVIFILNQLIYCAIANSLTRFENHRTQSEFDRSLIIKRFCFDAFDSYIALFYLAFYEVDVTELSQALLGLFMTDTIRRLITECAMPLLTCYARYNTKKVADKLKKKTDVEQDSLIYKEIYSDESDEFNDYLEMVIQYGYIVLFAGACPLASFFSIITSYIEAKADAFKLLYITKRPRVRRSAGIGIWHTIIAVITWCSVLTNVFIFGVTSEQMMQWFPLFFNRVSVFDASGQNILEQELKVGAGRYVLGFIFFLEHVLICVGLILHFSISNFTDKTRKAILAQDYQKNQLYLKKLDSN